MGTLVILSQMEFLKQCRRSQESRTEIDTTLRVVSSRLEQLLQIGQILDQDRAFLLEIHPAPIQELVHALARVIPRRTTEFLTCQFSHRKA